MHMQQLLPTIATFVVSYLDPRKLYILNTYMGC